MSTFLELFGWPSGSVLTNLVASVLWAAPTAAIAVWRARVHLQHLHRRHDFHENQINTLHTKVNELLGQVRATMPPVDYRKLLDEVERQKRRNGPGGL